MTLEERFQEFLEKYIEERTQTRMRLDQGQTLLASLGETNSKLAETLKMASDEQAEFRIHCMERHSALESEDKVRAALDRARSARAFFSPQTVVDWLKVAMIVIPLLLAGLGGAAAGIKALVNPAPSNVATVEQQTQQLIKALSIVNTTLEKAGVLQKAVDDKTVVDREKVASDLKKTDTDNAH